VSSPPLASRSLSILFSLSVLFFAPTPRFKYNNTSRPKFPPLLSFILSSHLGNEDNIQSYPTTQRHHHLRPSFPAASFSLSPSATLCFDLLGNSQQKHIVLDHLRFRVSSPYDLRCEPSYQSSSIQFYPFSVLSQFFKRHIDAPVLN